MLNTCENRKLTSVSKFFSAKLNIVTAFCFLIITFVLLSLSLWHIIPRFMPTNEINVIVISPNMIKHITGKYYVSYGLDTSNVIGNMTFNISDPKFQNLVSLLGPAYLRIGGNAGDQLIFDKHSTINNNNSMNAQHWRQIYNFFHHAEMNIIFGLNALIRYEDGNWNSSNAEQLINFSHNNNLFLHWELGNEPNSFEHKFNMSVNATQLAKDFRKIRTILNGYNLYRNSMLLGPDTTRPVWNNQSVEYFEEFIKNRPPIDVLTWHQYYLNGHNTSIDEFLSLDTFKLLESQIKIMKQLINASDFKNFPIWLGETSSAYGGGAPNLSNSYVASFLWLDKLGLSAQYGLKTIIRQSIYGGYYALINEQYEPNPDWWITILYRTYVGPEVLECYRKIDRNVRLYCHCASQESSFGQFRGVTSTESNIFGINLNSHSVRIRIRFSDFENEVLHRDKMLVFEYTVTGINGLLSRDVALNKILLKLENGRLPSFHPHVTNLKEYHTMPPFSIVFWVIHGVSTICSNQLLQNVL